MEILQHYKDWLLLNRGEIRPELGDKLFIILNGNLQEVEIDLIENNFIYIKNSWYIGCYDKNELNLNGYVKTDNDFVNNNEIINFANYLLNELERNNLIVRDGLWKYLNEGSLMTSEELVEQFKQLNNESK